MVSRVLMTLTVLALLAPCTAVADPPAESGPYVVRYEDSPLWAGWLVADAKRGYFSFIGWDPYEFCTNFPAGIDIMSIQEVQNPQNEDQINVLVKMDDVYAAVWEWVPGTPITCPYILENPPLAVGTADGTYTDNDLYADLSPDEERTNTWTLSAHGKVMDDFDESFNLNTGFHCRWPDRYAPVVVCKQKVILK